jgi:hypothetical protein
MTALVFVLQPEYVVFAMDSLSLRGDNKLPGKYCTKAFLLPHLGSAICGTGALRLVTQWHECLQLSVLARDVDYINETAPHHLRRISSGIDDYPHSTIYHFGLSSAQNAFVGAAFRSSNDFACEAIPYGIGVKPGLEHVAAKAEDRLDELGYADGIVWLFERLREHDDSLPAEERVGIGGEIHLFALEAGKMSVSVLHQWPDYDETYDEMLVRLEEENAAALREEQTEAPA